MLLVIIVLLQIRSVPQKIKWGLISLVMIADVALAAQLNVASTVISNVKTLIICRQG